MLKIKFLVLILLVANIKLFSQDYDTLTDNRDGQKYKIVKIDNQVWMAENLNYQVKYGSLCYNDSAKYCKIYGKLQKMYAQQVGDYQVKMISIFY